MTRTASLAARTTILILLVGVVVAGLGGYILGYQSRTQPQPSATYYCFARDVSGQVVYAGYFTFTDSLGNLPDGPDGHWYSTVGNQGYTWFCQKY